MKVKHYNLDGTIEEKEINFKQSTKDIANSKIKEYEYWFETYFDKQIRQSFWQKDFKPSYDSIFNKEYENTDKLIEFADTVRLEIKKLRKEINQ